MGAHKIAMLVVYINLLGPGADFKRFLEILARHGVVHLVEGEGEIRANLNAFPFQILILRIRQREQGIPFLRFEQIPSGITEILEGLTILLFHLLPQNGVQPVDGVEGHLIHLNQDVHGDNLHMPFNIWLPAGLSDLGRHDDGAVVLRPGLEILVEAGFDPVLVLGDSDLTVVRRNRLSDASKVGNGVVVDSKPVADVAAGHSLDVEIVAERQGGDEDGHFGSRFRIAPVMDAQRFPGKVQFQVDAGDPLDVESDLGAVQPVGIAPTILAVAQRLATVHRTGSIILPPQVLKRFSLPGQGAMNVLRIEVPVEVSVYRISCFLIQLISDELIGDICGKRIGQFPAFPEALQELVDRGFPVTCDLCDLPAAHSIGEMKNEHSLVVHIRTSS